VSDDTRQARKILLFLKKKKQKDFYPGSSAWQCRRHCPRGRKVLFFKKEYFIFPYATA
jgi:hypothetical protein